MLCGGDISNERRFRISRYSIEYITNCDSISTELTYISIIGNLEYMTLNVSLVIREKLLDVVAIDGLTTIIAKFAAEWSEIQTPESNPAHSWYAIHMHHLRS